jgi:hypothetical protein
MPELTVLELLIETSQNALCPLLNCDHFPIIMAANCVYDSGQSTDRELWVGGVPKEGNHNFQRWVKQLLGFVAVHVS